MKQESDNLRDIRLLPVGVGAILVAGWAFFTYGYLAQAWLDGTMSWVSLAVIGVAPIALAVVVVSAWRHRRQASGLRKWLEEHTDAVDAIPDAHVGWWIALVAGLGLYTELMIIRVHGSYFHLFAYFKNVSLMSCFLGLGLGYILGSRRPLTTPLALPMLAAQIAVMYLLRSRGVATGLQNPIAEQLTLGMAQAESMAHLITVYGFVVLVFAFNALCFVPLGQIASRLMLRREKLDAYGWNLAGSLGGILLFTLVSFVWTPPPVWLFIPACLLVVLFRRETRSLVATSVAGLAVIAFLSYPFIPHQIDVYSPYQILTLKGNRESGLKVDVNNIYYQRILNLSDGNVKDKPHLAAWREYYGLPYRFKPAPEDVLIVGSGTGNDVAAALRHGAKRVDAVEIDPAILKFGRVMHPEAPYQNSAVASHATDARAFIRNAERRYDLIVYGLLDSHTLLSGNSGVRLDSFVYTVEAFREARERLKPGGVIAMSFSMVRPELGRKLYLMLEQAFEGRTPVVYETGYDGGYCYLIGDDINAAAVALPSEIRDVTATCASAAVRADLATDDWPFFYMGVRTYPASYLLLILVLLAVSTIFVWQLGMRAPAGFSSLPKFTRRTPAKPAAPVRRATSTVGLFGGTPPSAEPPPAPAAVAPGRASGPNAAPAPAARFSAACFFLGAGFMLVETKGITELALVFGSTWVVICAVITAILVLAYVANLLVMRHGSPRLEVAYSLLIVSLTAGLLVSRENLSMLSDWQIRLGMTLLLTLPLFFAGFVFSSELKASPSVAVALSSNLLGAMLGGFLEYNAMYFGYRSLYVLAMAMYGLAFVFAWRTRALAAAAKARGEAGEQASPQADTPGDAGRLAAAASQWWHQVAGGDKPVEPPAPAGQDAVGAGEER